MSIPSAVSEEVKILLKHAKLGIYLVLAGSVLVLAFASLRAWHPTWIPDVWMAALLSIPVTLICMGVFSVAYEYSMRTTFSDYMRSALSAFNTGVYVLPTHKLAPDRAELIVAADHSVKLMSTTFMRYFTAVQNLVEERLKEGVIFTFIVYNPDSHAIEQKADEEGRYPEDFKDEIISVCRRWLGPLVRRYGPKIQVKFCDFNTPFGITILDKRKMVLSLNIFGLSRSKKETPCLVISNTFEKDSVFTLYEQSYEAIWNRLDDSVPHCVRRFFEDPSPGSLVDSQP